MKILILVLALSLQVPAFAVPASSVETYRARQETATPQSVLKWLQNGNKNFVHGQSIHGGITRDARDRVEVSAQGQRPLATILSCIDSRTAPEVVFDTSVGDLFTARVAGTVVNEDILGSLEIAAESGSKVIVVLGHTDCGAIKGACTNLELGHLTQLIERVKPSIEITNSILDKDQDLSAKVGARVVRNRRYVAEVSHTNARQSRNQILEKSSIIRKKVEKGEIILVSAIYDVETGSVKFDW